jgi:hypothetical protein
VQSDLFGFAYCPKWAELLNRLEKLALLEDWKYKQPQPDRKNTENPILENYIIHTFRRLAYEYDRATPGEKAQLFYESADGNKLCFHTGLFTRKYEIVYACFAPNPIPNQQRWMLKGFSDNSDPFFDDIESLPRRANYFANIAELIYDTKMELRVNKAHILGREENRSRLPEKLRDLPMLDMLFQGAVELAMKKVEANYKAAVPQFYDGEICFLLPICLSSNETVDLSLAVKRYEGFYKGTTCLTLDMAYNNARLLACPNSDWLRP